MTFFEWSKVLGFFASISNTLAIMGLLGLVLSLTPWRRAGCRLLALCVLLIAIAGYSPLGNVLIYPLEQRFPPWDASRGAPDGVILLGGALGPSMSAARGTPALGEAAERLTIAAELARRYPNARFVYTGGSPSLFGSGGQPEADFAVPMLESFGIARERIIVENRSRNTVENAIFTRALVEPQPGERWLLVTSAYHMPRSMGTFRAQNFPVEAFPVDWRTHGSGDLRQPFDILADGLKRTDAAAREWTGVVMYWLTGRSAALFPAP